jgi:broad specificity phosphatase PhoE
MRPFDGTDGNRDGPHLIAALRHGEKPVDDKGQEIPDQPGLCDRGAQRALKLAEALRPGSPMSRVPPSAGDPSRILVPHYNDVDARHRCYQTVQPLAASIGLCPTACCQKDDVGGLVDAGVGRREVRRSLLGA